MSMPASSARQRGISLLVVMVMLLLSALLVLGASRTALIAEMAAGHDSDHQRALEAAQAMLNVAELGIRRESANGPGCAEGACRRHDTPGGAPGVAGYPRDLGQWHALQAALGALNPSCAGGICIADRVPALFWTDPKSLAAMKRVAGGGGNAWYWVELLPYDVASAVDGGRAESFAPDASTPFVYRVTVVAEGLKPSSRAVLQTTLVWKKERS
jgi:type IV pilus assembly protein PilX